MYICIPFLLLVKSFSVEFTLYWFLLCIRSFMSSGQRQIIIVIFDLFSFFFGNHNCRQNTLGDSISCQKKKHKKRKTENIKNHGK